MTQNKVSDCHGAKIIGWHNQPDFCEKCGKPCTPVEAKKLDVDKFLAESEEAGAALKRKDAKPPEDREFVGDEKKIIGYHCSVCNGKNIKATDNEILHFCEGILEPIFSFAGTRPTGGWLLRFGQFWLHNEDVTFVIEKMTAKIGDVSISDMREAIEFFFATEIAKAEEKWVELVKIKNEEIEFLEENEEKFSSELAKKDEEIKKIFIRVGEIHMEHLEEIARKNTEIENWKWAKEELQRNQEGELAKAREEGRQDAIFGREYAPSFRAKWNKEGADNLRAELREKGKEIWLPEKFNHESWCDAKDATWENPRCNCNQSAYYDLVCELKKFLSLLAEPNNEKK